jgi:hypothetical protein
VNVLFLFVQRKWEGGWRENAANINDRRNSKDIEKCRSFILKCSFYPLLLSSLATLIHSHHHASALKCAFCPLESYAAQQNAISVCLTRRTTAVPWLRRLVAGLSLRRPGLAPGSIHVGFVVDKVAVGQVFLPVLRFSPVDIIPPSLSKLISYGECVIC